MSLPSCKREVRTRKNPGTLRPNQLSGFGNHTSRATSYAETPGTSMTRIWICVMSRNWEVDGSLSFSCAVKWSNSPNLPDVARQDAGPGRTIRWTCRSVRTRSAYAASAVVWAAAALTSPVSDRFWPTGVGQPFWKLGMGGDGRARDSPAAPDPICEASHSDPLRSLEPPARAAGAYHQRALKPG